MNTLTKLAINKKISAIFADGTKKIESGCLDGCRLAERSGAEEGACCGSAEWELIEIAQGPG
jgi:hypothetical protein